MVHTESVNLVTHITGLGCTSARTVAINIQTHINDTIVEIGMSGATKLRLSETAGALAKVCSPPDLNVLRGRL